jgi:uncharacterized protein YceK
MTRITAMTGERILGTLGLGLAVLTLSGCMTVSELAYSGVEAKPYGATKRDYAGLTGANKRQLPFHNKYLCALDMPFTAVADTVLLPANGIRWAYDEWKKPAAE